MERPSLGDWFIPIILSATAVVTAWAGHNMAITFRGAVGLYVVLFALAIAAFWWRKREWRAWKAEDTREKKKERETRRQERKLDGDQLRQDILAADKIRLEAYLSEQIACEGGCHQHQPRSDFWLVDNRQGMALREVCGICFLRHFHVLPTDADPKTRRAFLALPWETPKAPGLGGAISLAEAVSTPLLRTGVDANGNPVDPYGDLLKTIPEYTGGNLKK